MKFAKGLTLLISPNHLSSISSHQLFFFCFSELRFIFLLRVLWKNEASARCLSLTTGLTVNPISKKFPKFLHSFRWQCCSQNNNPFFQITAINQSIWNLSDRILPDFAKYFKLPNTFKSWINQDCLYEDSGSHFLYTQLSKSPTISWFLGFSNCRIVLFWLAGQWFSSQTLRVVCMIVIRF